MSTGNKMEENKHDEETPFLPPSSSPSSPFLRRGNTGTTVASADMGTFDKSHDALSIEDNSTKDTERESDVGICWFHPPEDALDFEWLFSIRGAENMYLYFWLLKDLSWAQDWYYPAYTFGSLAIAWSFIMVCNAVYDGATNEVFTSTAMFLWLFANFWWMTGDIHDYVLNYPDDDYSDWYDSPPLLYTTTLLSCYIKVYNVTLRLSLLNLINTTPRLHTQPLQTTSIISYINCKFTTTSLFPYTSLNLINPHSVLFL